jgi:hypothetical protein
MSQLYFAYFYTGQTRANHFFQLLAPEISIGYPEPESNFIFFRFRIPGIEPESNRNFAKYPESNRNEKNWNRNSTTYQQQAWLKFRDIVSFRVRVWVRNLTQTLTL